MHNKIAGAILLSMAGLIVAIDTIGLQIADAIVLGQFYAANRTGTIPTGPENAGFHIGVIIAASVLAVVGLICLLRGRQ